MNNKKNQKQNKNNPKKPSKLKSIKLNYKITGGKALYDLLDLVFIVALHFWPRVFLAYTHKLFNNKQLLH